MPIRWCVFSPGLQWLQILNAWGGATYCSWDLWKEFSNYEDKTLNRIVDDEIRRHYSVASYGETYTELNIKMADTPMALQKAQAAKVPISRNML